MVVNDGLWLIYGYVCFWIVFYKDTFLLTRLVLYRFMHVI